ncbi:MAG TPA: enoyl-[acyl-carrier-protein] reductase [Polyangiaceae bacterium]|nr:enoyl-[acyl-carrier-protein] reductase [Polyangiaceae bacterium]
MISVDLKGRRALVAGVSDDVGFGFAIARALAEAGASVCLGCWPPALGIFETLLRRGKLDAARQLGDGRELQFERIYPLDAAYDSLADVPADVRENRRYSGRGDFTISGLAARMREEFAAPQLDILVHCLANGPEVHKPLLETSRQGYLAALSVSSYSLVSMVQQFAPLMPRDGSVLSLTYIASQRVIPGYGGGMSSAKAAMEADTRYLAFQAGRKYGIRINTISAGPVAPRAASVTGVINEIVDYYAANAPLPERLTTREVASVAAFLSSPLASAITGTTIYVDKGFHAMGKALGDSSDGTEPAGGHL